MTGKDTFKVSDCLEILERTPTLLRVQLHGLSDKWIHNNEGPDTWSPFDVVGHLIHGEKTDWIPRLTIILDSGKKKTFEPFDRFAQFRENQGKTLTNLLDEFESLRKVNLRFLESLTLGEQELSATGIHPEFGEVTARELLACWTVHDLTHVCQIARTMGYQYRDEVGPWKAYLGILSR